MPEEKAKKCPEDLVSGHFYFHRLGDRPAAWFPNLASGWRRGFTGR